jgi:hypothetical protein
VKVPLELETERVTDALLSLGPKGQGAVEWEAKKAKAA